jgi:hypothetical protein
MNKKTPRIVTEMGEETAAKSPQFQRIQAITWPLVL